MICFLQVIGWYGTVPDLVLVHVIYGLPVTTLIFRNCLAGIATQIINEAMTGAVVAALPTALICVFLGRYFTRGMLAGSVRG